jgi:hypothetical protein
MNFSWMVLDSNAAMRCSNRYRYPTLDELKCPILILQGFIA